MLLTLGGAQRVLTVIGAVVIAGLLLIASPKATAQAAVTDFASLQQAVAQDNAQGYGIIQLPPGQIQVTSEIDVNAGVIIEGYGSNASVLHWAGGNQPGSAVLRLQGNPLIGAHLRDFQIDGGANYTLGAGPGYGLKLVGVYNSSFENMTIISVGGQCIHAEPNAQWNTMHNDFRRIDTQFCDQAIWLGSSNPSMNSDVCCNTFTQFVGAFGLPGSTKPGMYIGQADANVFTYTQMWRWDDSGARGIGVELDESQRYHGSNLFIDLSSSSGGLWVHGTPGTNAISGVDIVEQHQMSNSEPLPRLTDGGRLTWTNDNGPNTRSMGWHLDGQLYQNGK